MGVIIIVSIARSNLKRRFLMKRFLSMTIITAFMFMLFTPALRVYALDGNATVYITKTGSCYHVNGCRHLSRSKIETTLSNALAKGLTPCSNCHPGTLDSAPAPTSAPGQEAPAPSTAPAAQTAPAQATAPVTVPVAPVTATTGWDCIYNETYYRAHNADVDAAYKGDSVGILQHFKTSGMKEGRRGCEEFDVTSYRAKNSDLNAAYGDDLAKYYYHYMNTGKAEGRSGK